MNAFDRRRFARQLLLAEIGEAGQARLCAARAQVPGAADRRAAAVARDYLERAGLAVLDAGAPAGPSQPAPIALALPDASGVRALAGRPELEPAAASLAGAFAAVRAIQAALGLGPGAALPLDLSLSPEKPA